jgi:hypothetical protein
MKKLFVILLSIITISCSENIEPEMYAQVVKINQTENGCRYELGGVVPYDLPVKYIDSYCGKYYIGQVIRF